MNVSEGFNPRATAWYTCYVGFIHNGSRYRTCGSDGRWSGTTPTCEGETLSISHMVVMLNSNQM